MPSLSERVLGNRRNKLNVKRVFEEVCCNNAAFEGRCLRSRFQSVTTLDEHSYLAAALEILFPDLWILVRHRRLYLINEYNNPHPISDQTANISSHLYGVGHSELPSPIQVGDWWFAAVTMW